MNNPFDYKPSKECDKAFLELTATIESLKESRNPGDAGFIRELEAGKMLGVLIAADSEGLRHILYAFSGQMGKGGFYQSGFVGPVFDYLNPDGYFKTKEREISRINREISLFEEERLPEVRRRRILAGEAMESEVSDYKERCRVSKLERAARREAGTLTEPEAAAMIRQSQFEKAELRRLKKKMAESLRPFDVQIEEAESELKTLKEKRKTESEALQQWLFSNFRLLNARGESKSLTEIFSATSMKVPPSGAGECCAPKLLQAAYLKGWRPVAIAEYWYGRPKRGEVRKHGMHYPACQGKCFPVLRWMLQGVHIEPELEKTGQKTSMEDPKVIYENEWFCVVDKPSGMLSVPGKGMSKSLQQWL